MQTEPLVHTDLGIVQGVEEDILGSTVQKFIGIPYAVPPVGELRFKKPQPISKWNGVKICNDFASAPWQRLTRKVGNPNSWEDMWNPTKEFDEDCLHLNIWKKKAANSSADLENVSDKQRPVMVWIFGGGFVSGSACLGMYDGSVLASQSSTIVVSISYRVGALGFLCLNEEDAPGNQGLWDQLLALKWIKSNIECFGGDSNNVTLFGESAGAVSICCHLLSPYSQPYFDKAILQSGCALNIWSILSREEMQKRGEKLCKLLAVDLNSCANDQLHHLRQISPEKLTDNQWVTEGSMQFPFMPIVDEDFLPDWPEKLLNKGMYKKCPILIGNTENEGSIFMLFNDNLMKYVTERKVRSVEDQCDEKEFEELMKLTFTHYPHYPYTTSQHIIQQIVEQYHNQEERKTFEDNLALAGKAFGHLHFTHDTLQIIRRFSEHDSVYLYHFNYRTQNDPLPLWTEVKHSDEIPMIFGMPLKLNMYTKYERELCTKMINWWTNFATYGKPSCEQNEEWLPFDNDKEHCLFIGPEIEMKRYHLTDIHDFWAKIYETYKKT